MPTLNWIGKDAVVKHHKDVPYRLLECVSELDCGESDSGNLIVQGDNLHALKALLPRYAGQVKCIYIDPPYNTGNEGWVYNDNVNSPEIRKWLGSVVGKEDETLDRHDRWLCMMYPRLLLLREFLRDDGVIFISIDDNEQANLKLLMDEIFGARNFLRNIIWHKKYAASNDAKGIPDVHDFIIVYQKTNAFSRNLLPRTEKQNNLYKYDSNDGKGLWRPDNLSVKSYSKGYDFPIKNPITNNEYHPPNGRCWMSNPEQILRWIEEGRIFFGAKGDGAPQLKRYLNEVQNGVVPVSYWNYEDVNHTDGAKKELKNLFSESKSPFETPKPTLLIERILQLATNKDSIILDTFAGSGTTAHAVLNLNKQDGGNRQFILVEMDKTIAETITAERNKRVIEGYNNAKNEPVEGLGGGFQFYRLSKEPLFTADGQVRPDVTFAQLAEFVWFKETGTGFTGNADSPLLGVFHNSAVYLLYNGILGDCDPEKGNVLTPSIYKTLPPFQGRKIIYATACRGGDSWLNREQIVLKQTPYELTI
jgi:site-specific DNA-methyltransferase (adenine-specific)/adenine-specific DNA-methyltransferase